ncbi:hypothetical protein [Bacillus thuringiensis]|uniref:hypothetical protein n=1 Tax=Bacillus thuringiensis TaxID=1428 RepID=UPI000BFD94F2|nr:hypothetical protein [Bacillus thuringiensis]PGM38526.1 hypothetical protein CN945_01280 [Bacillus thuringiensis]
MVRKIRYRQVLLHRCANHGRGTYAQQVQLQKSFWREDNTPSPTIERVREIHSSLGTWDVSTVWVRWTCEDNEMHNTLYVGLTSPVKPKACYKHLLQYWRWREQEKRTLEFFEREGC